MFLLFALAFFTLASIWDAEHHPVLKPAIPVGWACFGLSVIEFYFHVFR